MYIPLVSNGENILNLEGKSGFLEKMLLSRTICQKFYNKIGRHCLLEPVFLDNKVNVVNEAIINMTFAYCSLLYTLANHVFV